MLKSPKRNTRLKQIIAGQVQEMGIPKPQPPRRPARKGRGAAAAQGRLRAGEEGAGGQPAERTGAVAAAGEGGEGEQVPVLAVAVAAGEAHPAGGREGKGHHQHRQGEGRAGQGQLQTAATARTQGQDPASHHRSSAEAVRQDRSGSLPGERLAAAGDQQKRP